MTTSQTRFVLVAAAVLSLSALSAKAQAQGYGYGYGVPMVAPGFDPYRAAGPYLGAGAARGLTAAGVPAPVAVWAGGRINANSETAYRERNLAEAGVKIGTGISMQDIRTHGIAGGHNSEVRRIGRRLGIKW